MNDSHLLVLVAVPLPKRQHDAVLKPNGIARQNTHKDNVQIPSGTQ